MTVFRWERDRNDDVDENDGGSAAADDDAMIISMTHGAADA